MTHYYFAAQSDSQSAILWTADVAVGQSKTARRAHAAAAARALVDSSFFFKMRNAEVAEFRANLLLNCPEIPHFSLSAAQFLRILKGTANVANEENLSPRAFRNRLQDDVDMHRLSPAERDRIIINFNQSQIWIKKNL